VGHTGLLEPLSERLAPIPGREWLLGVYPVTVEEYRRFWAGRGYEAESRRHWSEAGWALRDDERWEAPGGWADQLRAPSRPVTRVSWYEAEAYCAWLAELADREVRLPWEAEWAAAATAATGEYPWGAEEPDQARANFGRRVGAPTPVGLYPAGAGPGGHLDLEGDVWEWCVDALASDEVPENDLRWFLKRGYGEYFRRLRGGSWASDAVRLRSVCRRRLPADVRGDNYGFRVCAAPAKSAR